MTNTILLAGPHDPDDIIRSVKRGVYAKRFGGGQVDISNGDFVFSLTESYLIEDGKLTAPLKGVNLIGNGPAVLRQVTMLGSDVEMSDGVWTCGKDGQSVPVGVGCPTVKIDRITVGGTRFTGRKPPRARADSGRDLAPGASVLNQVPNATTRLVVRGDMPATSSSAPKIHEQSGLARRYPAQGVEHSACVAHSARRPGNGRPAPLLPEPNLPHAQTGVHIEFVDHPMGVHDLNGKVGHIRQCPEHVALVGLEPPLLGSVPEGRRAIALESHVALKGPQLEEARDELLQTFVLGGCGLDLQQPFSVGEPERGVVVAEKLEQGLIAFPCDAPEDDRTPLRPDRLGGQGAGLGHGPTVAQPARRGWRVGSARVLPVLVDSYSGRSGPRSAWRRRATAPTSTAARPAWSEPPDSALVDALYRSGARAWAIRCRLSTARRSLAPVVYAGGCDAACCRGGGPMGAGARRTGREARGRLLRNSVGWASRETDRVLSECSDSPIG